MIQLSYVSAATRPMSAAKLLTILQQCYGHNPLHDITGLLLYGSGTFLQVLEGEEAAVTALYDKIEADARHRHVTCLARTAIETRHYPGWSMGFRRLSDSGWENEGGRLIGEGEFNVGFLADNDRVRSQLLSHFSPAGAENMDGRDRGLHDRLRRAEGGIEIARLVLEDVVEAHAAGRFGDTEGKLCRFALGQINGI